MSKLLTSRCSSCDAQIVWTTTERGSKMPVDATPTDDGTVAVWVEGPVVRSSVISRLAPHLIKGTRHKSHFATCPQAAQHRRAR